MYYRRMDIKTPSPADLKCQRVDGKILLEDIAAILDVHPTTLWRWEDGKTGPPNLHILKAWEVALRDALASVAAAS